MTVSKCAAPGNTEYLILGTLTSKRREKKIVRCVYNIFITSYG